MKKVFFVALLLIVLIVVCLFPVTKKQSLTISANFENIGTQVIHINNWRNWYPEIKNAYQKNPSDYHLIENPSSKTDTILIPGKKIVIHPVAPMSYSVSEISKDAANNFSFSIYPSDQPQKMNLYVVQRKALITTIFDKDNMDNPVYALKNYLEDPKELYGYYIEISEIRDPTIASTLFNIRSKDVFSKISEADSILTHYIQQKNLIKTGHISVSYVPKGKDSLQLTVGIPVNGAADSTNNVKCLSLPPKGRVLVGLYSGKFSERNRIYQAMTRYLSDHTLSIPAQSFERYLNDSLPTSDSSEINMELDYPIY